jgi:hypothetical protein
MGSHGDDAGNRHAPETTVEGSNEGMERPYGTLPNSPCFECNETNRRFTKCSLKCQVTLQDTIHHSEPFRFQLIVS